jgi:hypothetical protein
MLHASERPRPLRQVNPSVTSSPELEGVILRALEKNRVNRFASARDFAQALEILLPVLSDTPGEPVPVPLGTEPTDGATNIVARVEGDAATVVTIGHSDPTVQTALADAPPTVEIRNQAWRKYLPHLGAAAAAVIVLVLLMSMWNRDEPQTLQAAVPRPATASILVPAATGRVGINAFPWATVQEVRNVATGETVAIEAGLVTPAPIELAPGRYEITLANPSFGNPVKQVVDVSAGRDELVNVHFTDPATASLPSLLGGGR